MKSNHADLVAQLADEFGPMVFSTAYRVLGNREEASDAYQDVFLKLLKARKLDIPLGNSAEWGAYLRVAASRCALGILRRRSRWNVLDENLLNIIPSSESDDPRRHAIRQQRAELLRRALASLPERESRIFALHHFEGFSYEEIARQESMNAGTVGVTLHRAVKRLQEILTAPSQCGDAGCHAKPLLEQLEAKE